MTSFETDSAELTGEAKEQKTFTKAELICVLISYIIGRAYMQGLTRDLIIVFSGVVLMTAIINKGRKLKTENYVWLLCFALSTAGMILSHEDIGLPVGVWDFESISFFVHVFAVWFAFSASGKMFAGESSTYLIPDGLMAFIIVPFRFIFERICIVVRAIKNLIKPKDNKERNYYIVPAVIICVTLFVAAVILLGKADQTFGKALEKIGNFFKFDYNFEIEFYEFLFSLPVGAYLFGLTVGSTKFEDEKIAKNKDKADAFMQSLKKIPAKFWAVVICLFSLLYLTFYAVQFKYFFGAFTRTLPDGFIVSQYAREGFFELCKVMAVNFALLFTVTRMASDDARENKLLHYGCLAILTESIIFAVIAFSKLALYIDCFGFTPLRIQSTWLVIVLFLGCILWMINLIKGKKTFKIWMMAAAVSLSALCLL